LFPRSANDRERISDGGVGDLTRVTGVPGSR
jgi:hypothetical protein